MSSVPLDTGSGDPRADRRADYAAMLAADGDWAAAAEVMLGALELAPTWAFGWFRLGELEEGAGRRDAAAKAWRAAQALDPLDHAGAALKLALAQAAPALERPPSAFVETLFDQYAARFDGAIAALGYQAPALLLAAIRRVHPERFARALDLGCGTGLMGERLRPCVDVLSGCDLSAAMLARARAKNVYDDLFKADLQDLPFAAPPLALVSAADVFMYVGRLDAVFLALAPMLDTDGLFAFTAERFDGEGFALRDTRRFAHNETYLRETLDAAGFRLLSLEGAVIRQDRDTPVDGLVAVAQRA